MSNRSERKRKRRQTEKRVILAVVLLPLLLLLMVGGVAVYAKYYSQSYENGIAIATGIYFTSNYAVEVDANEETYFESVVDAIYQGSNYSFEFEVRNYENNLLFNESSVNIPYSVSFWLDKVPVGASYTVTYGKAAEDGIEPVSLELTALTEQTGKKATFSMQSIAGGKAMADIYTIDVTVQDGAEYIPATVYAEVKTEAGSIINSVLRGRMVLNQSASVENYIDSHQFIVSDSATTDEAQFAEIQKKSGLVYEIRTVGEIDSGSGVTEELILRWDPSILQIDLFDEAYEAWKERTHNSGPLSETKDGKVWNYITLEVMPYSSQTVQFFRGENFDSVDSMETLYKYIEAEMVQATDASAE